MGIFYRFGNYQFIIIIMEIQILVLEAMKKAGEPVNAGKVAELTGLDRKEVDKAMVKLKNEGLIISPQRCYWQPK
jgi:DNA-binding IscR family transcriptional regulator